jgi:thiosulfate/3-mercaptopyruvate sulfurtransferase
VWKSKEELQAAYTAQGITPDKYVIASCGQGLMSAHTYVTLKYILGYLNVANYDGGFNEWSSHADLPVKTGDQP